MLNDIFQVDIAVRFVKYNEIIPKHLSPYGSSKTVREEQRGVTRVQEENKHFISMLKL